MNEAEVEKVEIPLSKEQLDSRIAQLMDCFDVNLNRLQQKDFNVEMCEEEGRLLDLLADYLEEALECGATMETLQSRAQLLAKAAFDCGYNKEDVQELLTLRPNPFISVQRN
ncbi:hypothetical protein [Thiomicrorhabdus sediminis]|uniref:Uncharacterized protein n=1 Tax=Thiomicrorhabdus sediminis TaxID=2580412 RepID=A0A4P9K6V1_9GAMM|nr:hypothetical protein [Thiomicrorhabdus sediminis]QCU90056.1 hypothetical protein FE785_05115 [Thiomicrorhabdus sediminis]